MPRPAYIICSESGVIDQSRNLASHFSVLEKITFQRRPVQERLEDRTAIFRCRVVAVWMKTDEDTPGQEFEAQLVFVSPPNGREIIVAETGRFAFAPDKTFSRFVMQLAGPLPAEGAGILWVKHRIRVVGDEEWMTQEFPIVIVEESADEETAEHDTRGNEVDQVSNGDR